LNIVFDLGGVVFDWNPDKIVSGLFESTETRNLVKREIFGHADWVDLDRGTLEFDQAVSRGAERTGLPPGEIERLLNVVPASLTPFPETIDLIRFISKTNNQLFVLSNMHLASIEYLEKAHDIWRLFDGTVISCRIQKVKPEPEIYKHLLSEYQLIAAETVFIDDLHENVQAAVARGIQGIQFKNAAQCRQDLARLGVL
jgi:putative hydrolase of the HAD superfamily